MKLDVLELLEHTINDGSTGCLLWTGARMRSGYAEVSRDGRRGLYVHRLVWEHFHGPIPPGMFVCHRCDVRHCLSDNAEGTGHLFLGTPADNIHDALAKKRLNLKGLTNLGEAHPNAKLTTAIVRSIRQRVAECGYGECMNIARELEMTVENIRLIVKRKAWSHVA